MLLRGKHYRTGARLDVRVEGGRILAVDPPGTGPADLEGEFLAPALVDVQINGGHGVSFTSDTLTVEDVEKVARLCHARGIGHFCPTVVTASSETICHALRILARACAERELVGSTVPGFHLEGPYLSPEDGPRGAHPRRHVRPASVEEFRRFQDAAGGHIRIVTLAPEMPGALELIAELKRTGVLASIGHSAATPVVIREAVRAGASMSTHLGNGCARLLPRHENLIWEQLVSDDLTASFIPDGHHLPWSVVRVIQRCLGPAKLLVTCDASPLAGLPPGQYQSWDEEVEILPEGKIVLPSQGVLAGSWDFTNRCVEKLLRHADQLAADEVHDLASVRPASLLRIKVGVEVGLPARLVVYGRGDGGELHMTHAVIGDQVHVIPATASGAGAGER